MFTPRTTQSGEFVRAESGFRHWITADGRAGPSGQGGFKAERDRYHLIISHACPWAHRVMIVRALKGLEGVISVSVVHPLMPAESWVFGDYPGATADPLYNATYLYQIYQRAEPQFNGLVTVPVLWDKQRQTLVNNESSEIMRMLNTAFNAFSDNPVDFYPAALQTEIDAINDEVYHGVNNGVYRAGFASTQTAYEVAFDRLFQTLDALEALRAAQGVTGNTQLQA